MNIEITDITVKMNKNDILMLFDFIETIHDDN